MKQLTRFSISDHEGDQFLLRLEDDSGETVEYLASPEQIDAVIEALDDLLSDFEEEVFEVQFGPDEDDDRPPRPS